MTNVSNQIESLLEGLPEAHRALVNIVRLEDGFSRTHDLAPRALIAMALNIGLLGDLLDRSPSAAAYVNDLRREGRRLTFDHGAVRTVDLLGMGGLPRGIDAITRLLEPLGYVSRSIYPLNALRMTGWAFTHADLPEHLPQFFVSELHVERFSPAFQDAVRRVTDQSRSPLDAAALTLLVQLKDAGALPVAQAKELIPVLVNCFARHHPTPAWSDYEILRAESAEMAWIATEGNVFNHATDRVASLEVVTNAQESLGRAVKPKVEVSASGRVRQTALRADEVERTFIGSSGEPIVRSVPGSFFEFIERDQLPEGGIDLRFDSANAQGIFKMTEAAAA